MNVKKLVPYAIEHETDINKLRKFAQSQFERQLEAIEALHEYMTEVQVLESDIDRLKTFSLSQLCKLNDKINELEQQVSLYESQYKAKKQ